MPVKILLIEDNLDHIMFTKRILEKNDGQYYVDSASEAQEGLKKLIEESYDLILCDYRMPGFTALDMLKEMSSRGKDLPFVVVTASGSEKVAVALMKEGAYDYIIKDLSYEDTLPVVIKRSIERFNAKKEKEKLEHQIEQAAREWEVTFDSIADAIFIVHRDYKIARVNKATADMFKMKQEEIIGRNCYEIFHGVNEPWKYYPFKQVLDSKKPICVEFFEPQLKIYLEISISPIMDENGMVISTVHIAKDITERKQAEKDREKAYHKLKQTQEELVQSSKMAAIGQLASGISHELNQPLTGIKGFAQAMFMEADESNPFRSDLNKIIEQADRMDKIIKNVSFFARKSEFKMEPLDINIPIEDSFVLLSEQLRVHNIRVEKLLAKNLPKIKADSNQLQQVFLNLITNSRDAIDSLKSAEGGKLIIKTSLSEDKKNIIIIFKDTGCGISKEDLTNIFNPFFTTKSPGGGIGLGLCIAYRIIDNHAGRIEAESTESKGATFKITLPLK
jgi:PAS domain S-box-containing protein